MQESSRKMKDIKTSKSRMDFLKIQSSQLKILGDNIILVSPSFCRKQETKTHAYKKEEEDIIIEK